MGHSWYRYNFLVSIRFVKVSNQTGGTACLHPEVEGIFLPLNNDYESNLTFISPEIELSKYFEGSKYRGTGATSGIDIEDANFINTLLESMKLKESFEVNTQKLKDSHEAWIWLTLKKDQTELFEGFEAITEEAILTWANSD